MDVRGEDSTDTLGIVRRQGLERQALVRQQLDHIPHPGARLDRDLRCRPVGADQTGVGVQRDKDAIGDDAVVERMGGAEDSHTLRSPHEVDDLGLTLGSNESSRNIPESQRPVPENVASYPALEQQDATRGGRVHQDVGGRGRANPQIAEKLRHGDPIMVVLSCHHRTTPR